jgi:hypothetical protein
MFRRFSNVYCSAMLVPMLVMTVLLLVGCAASGGSPAGALLGQDYQKMTNPELTAYEQALSEEIARSSGSSGGGGTSIGFGLGSWGSSSGFGLGVEQSLGGGGGGGAPVELRDRREAVRVEMRRRGLLPPVAGGQ